MTDTGAMHSLRRLAWYATTVSTGILAGFLTSHSVMLGRFFTWLIESGNERVLTEAFAPFRHATRANAYYDAFLWIALAVGALWTVLSFVARTDRIVAVIAGLSSFWTGCVFFASGFSDAEKAVASGVADEATKRFFVAWNLPMHTSFAVFYMVCLLLLLRAGCRQTRAVGRP